MEVLVACECSGRVRDAFRARGHNAYSCDIQPCDGDPEYHIQSDVLPLLKWPWDLVIAHPPCTYLSYVGNRHLYTDPTRKQKLLDAVAFFCACLKANSPRVAVENPLGYMSVAVPHHQVIHPYYFGEPIQKRTCLWLKGLPPLEPTNLLPKPKPLYYCVGPKSYGKTIGWTEAQNGKNKSKIRSVTFQGIADAMAEQWGSL